MNTLKRHSWLRTWAFGIWLAAVSLLVTAATCKDVTNPPVVEAEDDTTESDTTEQQGFFSPAETQAVVV